MASGFPTARTKARSRIASFDWQMCVIVVGVVALFLALLIPFAKTVTLMLDYNSFLMDVTQSATYARDHDACTITFDGASEDVLYDGISRALDHIADVGMGSPNDTEPEGGVVIDFGDGSTLSLSEVPIDSATRENDTGVLVRYVRADGSAFAYDSDRLSYDALLTYLHLPS